MVIQSIPMGARIVLETLQDGGHEAYLVGGCVRDGLLGRSISDWDITTSARPETVSALFSRVIPTGISHGTVTVLMDGDPYEVTTYRVDAEYSDGRRPDSIQFTRSLKEDLARRDFTINAMAFDAVSGSLVDPFDGQGDLAAACIRAVGRAEDRLREDGLRSLRAVRFASQLGFNIDPDIYLAIAETLHIVEKVSAERHCVELRKILLSHRPGWGVKTLKETGLLRTILPHVVESNPSVFDCQMEALPRVKLNWAHRLAAFCLVSPEHVQEVCLALKVSNATRKAVTDLVMLRKADLALTERRTIFQLMAKVGEGQWADFLAFRTAVDPDEARLVERLAIQAKDLMVEDVPLKTTALSIDGKAVMENLGLKPSALIGLVLSGALTEIWCGRLKNERSELISALPAILAAVQGES